MTSAPPPSGPPMSALPPAGPLPPFNPNPALIGYLGKGQAYPPDPPPAAPVPAALEEPKVRRRLKIEPEHEGRLEGLLISYKEAKTRADEAGEQEDEYKSAIKAWLLSLFPDEADLPDVFEIPADPSGRYPAYTLSRKDGTHIDAKAMPPALVAVYETYRVPNKPTWEFRESTRRGRRLRGNGRYPAERRE